MAAGRDLKRGLPDRGQIAGLLQEGGAFLRADPDHHGNIAAHTAQKRAFGRGLGPVKAQIGVHRGAQKRAQIAKRGNRDDAGQSRLDARRQGHVTAQHPRHQMSAGRMAAQHHRPGHLRPDRPQRGGDFAGDLTDPGCGRQRVSGHRHRPAARLRPGRQMRPGFVVERPPIATVHEHHHPLRAAGGQEQIEPLAHARPVRLVEAGAPQGLFDLAPMQRRRLPAGRIGLGPFDMGAVCIGVVVIHDAPSGQLRGSVICLWQHSSRRIPCPKRKPT